MPDWVVPLSDVRFTEAEVQAVAAVYRSGWLSQGPEVDAFEREFAAFVGSSCAVAVASGTAALHLSLIASGVQPGDEVILPSLTFAATAAAVIQARATPVFVEIAGLDRPWLSSVAAQEAIGPRTTAIINVAYGGHPGEASALRDLADARGLKLIEDAAHALGARAGDRCAGTIGHVGTFSFFANKNLHLGEGGMLVTDDHELARMARLLRSHGLTRDTWARRLDRDGEYDVVHAGFNYRLDEPRAALARLLLTRLPDDNDHRARLAAAYAEALAEIVEHATPAIHASSGVRCAWHIYPVVLPRGVDRPGFRRRLASSGVQTSVHYPALHLTSAFAQPAQDGLALTREYADRTVTLPMFAHMTDSQQKRVIEALAEAVTT